MRTVLRAWALAAGTALLLSGCGFHGIQEMSLPGTTGSGPHSIRISVDLPDVSTLTPNGQVKVNDVNVGTVTRLRVVGWHARADVSLEPDVDLPENAVATVGVDSLLGAGYLQLSAPSTPQGHLRSGDRIPLSSSAAYPTTEQVLSAASFVLNGGGLEQISTITRELNQALGGDQSAVKDLLPRLDSFIGELNGQKDQIVNAIDDVDRLAASLNGRKKVINDALASFPSALSALSSEEAHLRDALASIGDLGDKATAVINASQADLIENLNRLRPTLEALAQSGPAMTRSLGYAVTFPFPPATVPNACKGDYCNLFLTLDLTAGSLVTLLPTTGGGTTSNSGGTTGNSGSSLNDELGNLLGGVGGLLQGGLGNTPVLGSTLNQLGQSAQGGTDPLSQLLQSLLNPKAAG